MKLSSARVILFASLPAALLSDPSLLLLPFVGFAAWIYVISFNKDVFERIRPHVKVLLGLLVAGCVLSMLGNHSSTALFGSSYSLTGALILLSCIGVGLTSSTLPVKDILKTIYAAALVLLVSSPLYESWRYGSLNGRLGGILGQPDVLGILLGIGFVVGLYFFTQKLSDRSKILLTLSQIVLLAGIYQTQTRAALALTFLFSLIFGLMNRKHWRAIAVGIVPALLVGVVMVFAIKVARLSDARYASDSVSYRLQLQAVAVKDLPHLPIWGVGVGNESKVLSCDTAKAYAPLARTCRDGYTLTSTHNIFLDRLLQLGWIAALAYITTFISGIILALRSGQPGKQLVGLVLAMIGLYYLTNITAPMLELVVWLLLGSALTD